MPREYSMRILLNAYVNQAVVSPCRFNGDITGFMNVLVSDFRKLILMYCNIRVFGYLAAMYKVECVHLIVFNNARADMHENPAC